MGKVKMALKLKPKKSVKDKMKKKVKYAEPRDPVKLNRGVVLVSHIPHGFYENEITSYFTQFGKVTGVNVPRSKSGRMRGFAFIEFEHPEVAQVAAETMNNYLMLHRLLKAKYIPPEEQKPSLFRPVRSKKEKLKIIKARKVKNENTNLTPEQEKSFIQRKHNQFMKLRQKLNESGINYNIQVNDESAKLIGIKKLDPEAV